MRTVITFDGLGGSPRVQTITVPKRAPAPELPYVLVKGRGDRYPMPMLRQGISPVMKLSVAAGMLMLSERTLLRAGERRAITLIVDRKSGRIYIDYNELIRKPFLSFGQIARVFGGRCRYEDVRAVLRQKMGQYPQRRFRMSLLDGYRIMNGYIKPWEIRLW